MEEAGLHPDYITGTSMGSIIGCLYAIGFTPDSMYNLAVSQNWNQVLSDQISLRQVTFEEKPYFQNQLIELPIRNGKVQTPGGLVQGQKIEEMLSRLTLRTYAVQDFDDLPIPFHCMAADIVRGVPVELSKGSLADALRASMAIPSIFTPVRKDSMVLVDGGLIRNFPVEELKDMGADIIIGVYVGAKPKGEQKLESITQILSQIAFMQSIEDYDRQLALVDIYIEPDLGSFGVQDFTSADSIIALGEKAARRHLGQLRALADSLDAIAPATPPRTLTPVDSIRIDRIEVIGNQQISDLEIIGTADLANDSYATADQLEQAIERLFGTNRFEKVSYRLQRRNDEEILYYHTKEKAPSLLKASLIYDSYHEAGVGFNFTFRNLLLSSSRLMLVGRLADNYRYRLEYLKYLDREERWFFNSVIQYNRDAIPTLEEGRITEEFRLRDAPVDWTLNRKIGRNGLLRLGAQLEFLAFEPRVSTTPLFEKLKYQNLNYLISLERNTLDRNVLPRRGNRLQLEIKYVNNFSNEVLNPAPELNNPDSLFGFSAYPRIFFRSESFLPLRKKSGLILSPFAGILGDADSPASDFYLIGAPQTISRRSIPFYGLEANEFVAQVALGMSLGFQYFLRNDLQLSLHFSGGAFSLPQLGSKGIPEPDTFLAGVGLTAAYNSLLGPFKLSFSYPVNQNNNIQRELKAFLTFGHRF